MSIRSAAKVVILKDDHVLLIRCRRGDGSVYYNLPGGGQDPFEPLEAALRREVMEETGCALEAARFAALYEEIDQDPGHRAAAPEYCHRLVHIFTANIKEAPHYAPSHPDLDMETLVWMPARAVQDLGEVYPVGLASLLDNILAGGPPIFMGTNYIE